MHIFFFSIIVTVSLSYISLSACAKLMEWCGVVCQDTGLNRVQTVVSNVFSVFAVAALRSRAYITGMRRRGDRPPRSLHLMHCIDEAVRFGAHLIQSRFRPRRRGPNGRGGRVRHRLGSTGVTRVNPLQSGLSDQSTDHSECTLSFHKVTSLPLLFTPSSRYVSLDLLSRVFGVSKGVRCVSCQVSQVDA